MVLDIRLVVMVSYGVVYDVNDDARYDNSYTAEYAHIAIGLL
ncbi:MAG: hypothetical protein AAF639_15370 [Chloroflexota bacterium]